ncbi:hypothetical protein QQF64_005691 [Cirrhinus molitorella]|uniref:Uncharacterized protein n=1 Tax=Cirrhinus molitorella TaxID=172907 RepID=A0ABR3MCW6_9TELE
MRHGCVNETLLYRISLHECAVTRGSLSNGSVAIPAGPPTARPISGYCLGSRECRDHQDRPFYLSHNSALSPPLHICSVFSALLYSFPHQPYPGTFPDYT